MSNASLNNLHINTSAKAKFEINNENQKPGSSVKCSLEHFKSVPPSHHVEILEMKGFSLLKRQSAFNLTSRNKCGSVFTA